MSDNKRIVAIGLLTQHDLERLGEGFSRAYPVDTSPCFGELLAEIDDADRNLWRERDRTQLIVAQPQQSPGRS